MRHVREKISKFAKTDDTILIQGETGVGKELVADAIHASSRVSHGPFVKVNCAAIPETLLESELFGHRKGAFTDAYASRKGQFEEAQNGTILLDEIGLMSLFAQAKLLRVLQDKEFQPVGSPITVRTNARIIATTNVNLEKAVAKGRFRSDLYYRLNEIPIYIPSLRERKEDVPPLIDHFLNEFCAELGKVICGLSLETFENLINFDWPGNVRQLKSFIKYAATAETSRIIQLKNIPCSLKKKHDVDAFPQKGSSLFDGNSLKTSLMTIERRIILEALAHARGKKSKAARILKIDRRNLEYYLRKHNMGFPGKTQEIPFVAEKRQCKRVSVSLPICYCFKNGRGGRQAHRKSVTFTEDISNSGLRFSLFSPPFGEIDKKVLLSIQASGSHMDIEGRVRWVRKNNISRYCMGAEFIGIEASTKASILSLLAPPSHQSALS